MQSLMIRMALGVCLLGLIVSSAGAFTCPALVEQCREAASKMDMDPSADKAAVARVKQGCEEALQLHESGQHAESVAKAKEAIQMAEGTAK